VSDPVGMKRRIGVVTQNNTLDMQLTVAENLEFRSRFFGLGLREASRRASQLLDVFGLADRRKAMSKRPHPDGRMQGKRGCRGSRVWM
jgi:ABC-type multidrug transport system ATPase subunit